MNAHPPRSADDRRWVEAMFADLQRQIDHLTDELHTLSHLVHAHTLATLKGTPSTVDAPPPVARPQKTDGAPLPVRPQETDDASPPAQPQETDDDR